MSIIVVIASSDLITNSRADINANFAALNADKIETSYLDTDTTLAANSDSRIATQKAVKAYIDSGGNTSASTTTKGIVQQATDAQVLARTTLGSTGAPLFVNPSSLGSVLKFGGTGADGALVIAAGTTTIDLGGAQVFIKNYTSISITGTGKLAFSNPHANGTIIILKSQGAVTITSSATPAIDVRGIGGAGGAGGADGLGAGAPGTDGTAILNQSNHGLASLSGGTAGAAFSPTFLNSIVGKRINLLCGAGGAGGTGGTAAGGPRVGGAGGRGGGALLIESNGALNFTGIINASGGVGGDGVAAGVQRYGSSGGGGGGAGTVILLYNTLTANTGTITVAGGAAGAGGSGGSGVGGSANQTGGGGGGAGYSIASNGTGGDGNYNGGAGGAGGAGLSLVAANTEFS